MGNSKSESKSTPERRAAFHRALGHFFTEWATLEIVLCGHLSAFLETDQFKARVVWASLPNWRARRELLARLAESYLKEHDLPAYRQFLKRAKGLGERRNAFAHRISGVDSETGKIFVMGDINHEEFGFLFFEPTFYDLTNVENWANDTFRLIQDASAFPISVHAFSKMHRALQADPSLEIGPRNPSTRARRKRPPQA